MVFDTLSPTDLMFESSQLSLSKHPLSGERDLSSSQTNTSKKPQASTNEMYTVSNRYQRLKPSAVQIEPIQDEGHRDSSITSSSSSSSMSSFDLHSNNNDRLESKTFSSSSGYNSSMNSIPDQLYPSSANLVEQFITLHLQSQSSFDRDITSSSSPPSSLSSTSSSFFCQEPTSAPNSPAFCRKCVMNNQVSSDTDDDSQSTIKSAHFLSSQEHNKRPRSLPIAIQSSKGVINNNDTDNSSENSSLCHCSINSTQKKRSRLCELTPEKICVLATQLPDNEPTAINQKKSLDHFIMSPTDKVKVQMKYEENDIKSNELKLSQPEEIDFKRSKVKAIRVLYQNRLHLNSIQSPVTHQNSNAYPARVSGHGDSPLAKRSVNPRLMRSALSFSVFEADDEHEVVSSATRATANGAREKSHGEMSNYLRINFTESLLHGKILPRGVLDGFTIKLGASGLFIPKQVVLPVTTFWFNVSEHQAASPYLGFINLQSLPKRGYHTPTKGTITLALLNPNGTAVHLFLILYDLSDMPPDHRTFIRQRVVLVPENTVDAKFRKPSKENLRYLAHIRFVTSQTGKLYMHSDIRLIFARNKLDYDERTGHGKPQLGTFTDVPTPKYWPRK